MPFFERGRVKVYYEEAGEGFPLLVIPGGGLNATIAGLAEHAFNPLQVFSDSYRVIALDLRNANDGHSCLLYTSPSPRDKRQSRMPSSA